MTNIETQAKTAFGKTLHYVTDPVYADALTRLTGKKTINDLDIINLQMLGCLLYTSPSPRDRG